MFADDIHEDMVHVYQSNTVDVEIINRHKIPLRDFLIKLDVSLIVLTAFISYLLAGITLHPIQRNDEAQKRFIANASHELRTPLAVLKADMEIYLLDKTFPKYLRPVFSGYLEEVDNMKQIVENMLTLFRFQSGHLILRPATFSVSQMIVDTTSRFKSFALSKKISIITKISSKVLLRGDQFFLELAYKNILKNAIEYSHTNSQVKIKLSTNQQNILVTVSDSGVGIPSEILNKVFNRYQRSPQSVAKRKEGIGLGLSITKQIIDLHSGTITINSVENKGTTVTILLPRLLS